MKKFSHRIAWLFFLTTIIPLLALGVLAITLSYKAAVRSAERLNSQIANNSADQIQRYLVQETNLLVALSQNIERTNLQSWQKETILKNYANRFPALLSIAVLDTNNNVVASSEVGKTATHAYIDDEIVKRTRTTGKLEFSPLQFTNSLLPAIDVAVPIRQLGKIANVLIAKLNVIDLWNLVEQIRVGTDGYAYVVDGDNRLIAHGEPRGKTLVLEKDAKMPMRQGVSFWGAPVLQASAEVPYTGWQVVVEQPKVEAFARARQLSIIVGLVALLVLVTAISVGMWGGKHIVSAVGGLVEATKRFAGGELQYKVVVKGDDELAQLAAAFNKMGDDLLGLQKEVTIRERMSTFGRVAAALAHDLKHPIQNLRYNGDQFIANYSDEKIRAHFKQVLDRELASMIYLVNQLRDISQKRDLIRVSLNVHNEISQVLQSLQNELTSAKVEVVLKDSELPLFILGDMMAIRRVIANIIRNAVEAMVQGEKPTATPKIDIWCEWGADRTMGLIHFRDNGCGIPAEKLPTLFDEFRSTKKTAANSTGGGLGLGMPIIKQLCEEHGGKIAVQSKIGEGTTITLQLPVAKGSIVQLYEPPPAP